MVIEELFYIEKSAYRDSYIHNLDARVKIIGMIALFIAFVAIPYSPMVFTVGAFFLVFLGVLWAGSSLSWRIYAKRLLMVLPFGLFIILFQIFFTNRYYTVFHVIASAPPPSAFFPCGDSAMMGQKSGTSTEAGPKTRNTGVNNGIAR